MNANPIQTVEFNVGGRHFEVFRSLIEQQPESMLGRFVAENGADPGTMFIDRDGDIFAQVLNYLRYGSIVLPLNIPKPMFTRDLEFYCLTYDDDDDGAQIISFTPEPKEGVDDEARGENREMQDQIRSLTEIVVTGPDHNPVYAFGHLKEKGHLSSLGAKGTFWTEWLKKGNSCLLKNIPTVEVWIGGTLRGGFSDNFQVLSWSKLGQKLLLFICSRPGNLVLTINFGWSEEELDKLVDIEQFCEVRDNDLLSFISEDLALEDQSKTCQFVSVSLPTIRNRLLGPSDNEEEGPPKNIW